MSFVLATTDFSHPAFFREDCGGGRAEQPYLEDATEFPNIEAACAKQAELAGCRNAPPFRIMPRHEAERLPSRLTRSTG